MPKLEPKQIQKELEQGQLWPVYWLYGQERMKSRELLKRIRRAALGEKPETFCAETLIEGTEVDAASIVDSAQSPSLGGGLRFIVVRDAHPSVTPLARYQTEARGGYGAVREVCDLFERVLNRQG